MSAPAQAYSNPHPHFVPNRGGPAHLSHSCPGFEDARKIVANGKAEEVYTLLTKLGADIEYYKKHLSEMKPDDKSIEDLTKAIAADQALLQVTQLRFNVLLLTNPTEQTSK